MNNNIAYNGYFEHVTTMEGIELETGDLVALNGEGKAEKAKAGNKIVGIVKSTHNGFYGVQTKGYVKLKFSGVTKPGYYKFSAKDSREIKIDETGGREYLVLEIFSDEIGLILE